jgi:two-component system response regulator FixJ
MTELVVHVIDDDAAMRDSLAFLLDTSGHAVVTYESALHFLEAHPQSASGVIVTDIRMPDMTGLQLVRLLNGRGSRAPVIVITGHADVPLAIEAMREGVVDFLEKPFEEDALLAAVARAKEGAEAELARSTELEQARAAFERLSQREHEVLQGIVAGKLNKTIAHELGISPRTVEVYRANVMTKTGASSLSELVRMSMLADLRLG